MTIDWSPGLQKENHWAPLSLSRDQGVAFFGFLLALSSQMPPKRKGRVEPGLPPTQPDHAEPASKKRRVESEDVIHFI